jgi:hypothetical protein
MEQGSKGKGAVIFQVRLLDAPHLCDKVPALDVWPKDDSTDGHIKSVGGVM